MSQHAGPPAGLAGTVDHVDAGDGWLVVRLLTRQAMDREGGHMDHCLGDGEYDRLAGDEDTTSDAVWSLRDPDGLSWATLDVRERRVVMASGPGGRTVRRSAARRLGALVMAFRAVGQDLEFTAETCLVMADDGRVMREDQAPVDVCMEARARHQAQIAEKQETAGEFLALGMDTQVGAPPGSWIGRLRAGRADAQAFLRTEREAFAMLRLLAVEAGSDGQAAP